MQICATATTVAFQGLEARRIEVQVQMTGGTPAIVVVGLGDKAVSEARERVRAAFASIGLAIPPGRLIVNLAPADMPKEGTHYDLPIARANHHVTYPARILLAAAMNPCRCGGGGVGVGACRRGPRCAIDYQARLSGPLLDRIDIQLDVPPVTAADLALPPPPEGTAEAAARVMRARDAQ